MSRFSKQNLHGILCWAVLPGQSISLLTCFGVQTRENVFFHCLQQNLNNFLKKNVCIILEIQIITHLHTFLFIKNMFKAGFHCESVTNINTIFLRLGSDAILFHSGVFSSELQSS